MDKLDQLFDDMNRGQKKLSETERNTKKAELEEMLVDEKDRDQWSKFHREVCDLSKTSPHEWQAT
mgnify:CR=1 FL=1